MNFGFLSMIIQLLIALGITLGVIFLSYKVLGTKVNDINKNKYIKVIERTQLSKDNSIFIVKIGKKGYVMTSTAQSVEKIDEMSEDEIRDVEENKERQNAEMLESYNKIVSSTKDNISIFIKNIKSKEGKNEK